MIPKPADLDCGMSKKKSKSSIKGAHTTNRRRVHVAHVVGDWNKYIWHHVGGV